MQWLEMQTGRGSQNGESSIAGTVGCCARAVSGHAATPPTSVMNSRLFSRSKCI
jgi:hypothetical protein